MTQPNPLVKQLQTVLGVEADGLYGDKTHRQAMRALGQTVAPTRVHTLKNPDAFFAQVRKEFDSLNQKQVDGFNALLSEMGKWSVEWTAYGLATAWHETASTMQPIAEYGKGKGRPYGVPDGTGQVPYGRGYVQLTWDYNYAKADQKLNLHGELIRNYELALKPDIAAAIMVRGMEEGWFTGKKLADYPADAINKRRIINGTDQAQKIAIYAHSFERALTAGGW